MLEGMAQFEGEFENGGDIHLHFMGKAGM